MQLTQRQLFLLRNAQTSTSPLLIEAAHAEGSIITDIEGKKYIDFISGISVSNTGHRHPKVIGAIQDQLGKYMHLMVYGEYVQSPQVKLADKLNDLLHKDMDGDVSTYFTNSGAEAVEGAMKLAKRFTGRSKFVAFKNSYHGHTHGAMSLSDDPIYRKTFSPLLPGVSFGIYNQENAIDLISEETAGVVIEIVQSEAGYLPGQFQFLQAIQKRCQETGTLVIVDEIQTGCGRTGQMFAFMESPIKPDILLLAKGFGGGMPIGAFIAKREVMNTLSYEPILGHLSTFGGHPVSCAAALANLEVIETEKLSERADTLGKKIRAELERKGFETSGKGMMLSVKMRDFDHCYRSIVHGLEQGLITDWFLFASDRIRISPPLNIPETLVDRALDILTQLR